MSVGIFEIISSFSAYLAQVVIVDLSKFCSLAELQLPPCVHLLGVSCLFCPEWWETRRSILICAYLGNTSLLLDLKIESIY